MRRTFVKRGPAAHLAAEAHGLRWLAQVPGGARVPEVLEQRGDRLVLPYLEPAAPTRGHAEDLGRALARTHAAGAAAYGAPWPGFVGPLPMDNAGARTWGEFYVQRRLLPVAEDLRPLVERLPVDVVPEEPVARLHGDLWNGNVVWTGDGAWLVDPCAHGGHRETDLAMLALFGLPHLDVVLAAYDEQAPLAQGWRERVDLHQLWPLLVHARLFGGSYARRAREVLERYC